MKKTWIHAIAIASTICLPVAASAHSYTFTNIVDDSGAFGPFTSFSQVSSINDAGQVAFQGFFGHGGHAIFRSSGGALTTIADTTGPFSNFTDGPFITADGIVTFGATLDAGGEGIFRSDGTSVATIVTSDGPFHTFRGSVTNASGTVAFRGERDDGSRGIFVSSGGPVNMIADETTVCPVALDGFTSDPVINASGRVLFRATLDAGGVGLFTGVGGMCTAVTTTDGPFSSLGFYPSMNDDGAVAFLAELDDGSNGIYIMSDSGQSTIADSSGPFREFGPTAINNQGDVAFLGALDADQGGIFSGGDPIADEVIQTLDPLFGSRLFTIFFRRGLNNNGDLTFTYRLTNGIAGIAVAHRVPEPIDGDFNDDGNFDCADVNALSHAIVTSGTVATFDLNGDGSLTVEDIDAWRAEAGGHNLGPDRVYTLGDANLDGATDGADFVIWNANKFHHTTNYCDANFNADIGADGADFVIWNANKFTSADSAAAVPEPAGLGAAMAFTLWLLARHCEPRAGVGVALWRSR